MPTQWTAHVAFRTIGVPLTDFLLVLFVSWEEQKCQSLPGYWLQ